MPYNSIIDRDDVGNIIPLEVTNELLKSIEESSTVLRMAKELRRMSRHEKSMPVLSALAMAYFVNGEIGLKKTTEVNWENVLITAEEVAVIVPVPQTTLDDATIDIWAAIRPELVTAFGVVIDNAILHGTNAPASWPEDIAAGAIGAGNTIAYPTGADLYTDTMGEAGTFTMVEQDGYEINGHIARLTMKGLLRGLRDGEGNLIFGQNMQAASQYFMDGQPLTFPKTGIMPATRLMFSGDWDQLVYSIRQDMTYKVATEGVINDAAGDIVYNLFQQDMVALRVVMRLGWALPNPINRENEVEATRYPFAVLTA